MIQDARREQVGNAVGNAKPSDEELERGILDAVRLGLADVARTLAAQLDERRRVRVPANVFELDARRKGPFGESRS